MIFDILLLTIVTETSWVIVVWGLFGCDLNRSGSQFKIVRTDRVLAITTFQTGAILLHALNSRI